MKYVIDLEFEGLQELYLQLRLIAQGINEEIQEKLSEGLTDIAEETLEFAQDNSPYWTGTLRGSHRTELTREEEGLTLQIYPEPSIVHPIITTSTVGEYAPSVALYNNWWVDTYDYVESQLDTLEERILLHLTAQYP